MASANLTPQANPDEHWCEMCADVVTGIQRDGRCENCGTVLDYELAAEYEAEAYEAELERYSERDWPDSITFRAAPYHGWPGL